MIGVLSAYALSYKMSIFDVLLDMKNLPYFPALREGDHAHTKAKHMMNGNFIFLTKASTLSDIVVLLQHVGSQPKSIPIVEHEDNKILVSSVEAQSLRKYLYNQYQDVSLNLNEEMKEELRMVQDLYTISNSRMEEFLKMSQEHMSEEA